MELSVDDLVKVLLAVLVGGLIGLEREYRDKAAGFRTLMFICLGSALFTIFSVKLAVFGDSRFGGPGDATRIASNIVAGVGFLGAGVILRDGGRVTGITTAATVWLVAALGMGIGAGQHGLALAVTLLTLLILGLFPWFEHWLDGIRDERTYQVVTALDVDKAEALDRLVRGSGLRVAHHWQTKSGARMTSCWRTAGGRAAHARLVRALLADAGVEELRY
jgi:putative Mg2+ transporter-C (MgtC) family protein